MTQADFWENSAYSEKCRRYGDGFVHEVVLYRLSKWSMVQHGLKGASGPWPNKLKMLDHLSIFRHPCPALLLLRFR